MSLGAGFKKVIDMNGEGGNNVTNKKDKLATIDNDGVTFKSHLDGSFHRFTPEISMQIQHGIGADITFAFDELTTLYHNYNYQVESLKYRTHPWAERSLLEHKRLNSVRTHRPPQALFGNSVNRPVFSTVRLNRRMATSNGSFSFTRIAGINSS